MKYLTNMTKKEAEIQNEAIYDAKCALLNCPTLKKDRVTRYKFDMMQHPLRDECALLVDKDSEWLLTSAEVTVLKTEAQMEQNGWEMLAAIEISTSP